jgi:hypothetical protein
MALAKQFFSYPSPTSVLDDSRREEFSRAHDSFAYFYCSLRDTSTHTIGAFLRTLIMQLCQPDYVFPAFRLLHNDCTAKYPPKPLTTNSLKNTLISILKQLGCPTEKGNILWNISEESRTRIIEPGENLLLVDGLDQIPQ